MGDPRNKWRKYEREAKMEADQRAQLARDAERARTHPGPRCACGFTWDQVTVMWFFSPGFLNPRHWWKPANYFCPSCLPLEYYEFVSFEHARLSQAIELPLTGDPAESGEE